MSSEKRPTATETEPPWSVIRLKEEGTGDLTFEFTFPVGDGTVGTLEMGNELSYAQMAQRLGRRTTHLPKAGAAAFIESLIVSAEARFIIKAQQPGWKKAPAGSSSCSDGSFTAFVAPGQIIGPGRADYHWPPLPRNRPQLGQTAGDHEGWSATVGKLAEQSNCLAFTIMFDLSTHLLPFVELPEDPLFNLTGDSSVGKTYAAKAGAGASGHPDAIRHWDQTERGLEETAAAYNHALLVLNAAEKGRPKHRREMLNRIVHMLAERESTTRSRAVQDTLPDLRWQIGVLCTSNKTGAEMAADLNVPWDPQDVVRFIDIPVPPAEEGGIFDRLQGKARDRKSTGLIQKLEKAIKLHYGVLLRPWIEYLFTINPAREVRRLMKRFLRRTGPHTGIEHRIAQKFALVYAAGTLAVEAGLLPWLKNLPWIATREMWRRARALRLQPDPNLAQPLGQLKAAISDPSVVRRAKPGTVLRVAEDQQLIGVRYDLQGTEVIALRLDGVRAMVGRAQLPNVETWLNQSGAVLGGHGNRATQQLPIKLRIGDQTVDKPRFLVMDAKRVADALAQVT